MAVHLYIPWSSRQGLRIAPKVWSLWLEQFLGAGDSGILAKNAGIGKGKQLMTIAGNVLHAHITDSFIDEKKPANRRKRFLWHPWIILLLRKVSDS
mmetsp:Transcript_5426/g.15262  ORF Transcript_5426/g.15262 Transcript_5426/m.15262 type:complete len:96 (+) Transcript_5426:22-309(+)